MFGEGGESEAIALRVQGQLKILNSPVIKMYLMSLNSILKLVKMMEFVWSPSYYNEFKNQTIL